MLFFIETSRTKPANPSGRPIHHTSRSSIPRALRRAGPAFACRPLHDPAEFNQVGDGFGRLVPRFPGFKETSPPTNDSQRCVAALTAVEVLPFRQRRFPSYIPVGASTDSTNAVSVQKPLFKPAIGPPMPRTTTDDPTEEPANRPTMPREFDERPGVPEGMGARRRNRLRRHISRTR